MFRNTYLIARKVATGSETSISITADGGAFTRASTCMTVLRGGNYLSVSSPTTSTTSPLSLPVISLQANEMAVAAILGAFGTVSGDLGFTTEYTTNEETSSAGGKFSTEISRYSSTLAGVSPSATVTGSGTINELSARIIKLGA